MENGNKKIDEKIFSKAGDLSSMADYQEGTIVSRTLLKSPAGNLTLFAFDAGQGLSEHTAPFDAFVQVLDGSALVTVSGVTHNLSAGDCILMPANEPHALQAEVRFKMFLAMIKG